MTLFLEEICRLLEAGNELAVLTIASQSGSTPRESGAKMAVLRDGSIVGTVGGGLVEAQCMRLGRVLLEEPTASSSASEANAAVCHFDLTNEQAAKAAMVCGGRLTVVAERFSPPPPHAADEKHSGYAALCHVRNILRTGQPCGLKTTYAWVGSPPRNLAESRTGMHSMRVTAHRLVPPMATAQAMLACPETGCQFSENFAPPPRLFIFGAGHVAQPTAAFAAAVGFSVTVLDDREEFACPQRFPQAQTRVLCDFAHALADVAILPDDSLVIMTRGHLHDRTVLRQALTTPARYVGMIGSKSKRDTLYDSLRAEGVAEESIARCHCPIGLPLGGRTPEEIGISIVAELIRHRVAGA